MDFAGRVGREQSMVLDSVEAPGLPYHLRKLPLQPCLRDLTSSAVSEPELESEHRYYDNETVVELIAMAEEEDTEVVDLKVSSAV
jgi:hypothetical protein